MPSWIGPILVLVVASLVILLVTISMNWLLPRLLGANPGVGSIGNLGVQDEEGVDYPFVPPGSAVVFIGQESCVECRNLLRLISAVAEGDALPRFHFVVLDGLESGRVLLDEIGLVGARLLEPTDRTRFVRELSIQETPLLLWFSPERELVRYRSGAIPIGDAEEIVDDTRAWSDPDM